MTQIALGLIFLAPLAVGVFVIDTSASRSSKANEVSRDLSSMYAQGVDFAQPANQNIAIRLAESLGLNVNEGKAVVILSKVHMVTESDCGSTAAAKCGNVGHAVIMQRFVMGNAGLRPSSLGDPAGLDVASGNVRNWATDESARAVDFPLSLKPGEYTYVAESFAASRESRSGVYARAMF